MLWVAPILLIFIYDLATILLKYFPSRHLPLPSPTDVTSLVLFGVLASPLWVLAGYSLTYTLGGFGVIHVIKLFSHSKLLHRKMVLQSKEKLEEISTGMNGTTNYLSARNYSVTLGLVLGLNLVYTLLIIRYFQNFFSLPRKIFVYQYLLSLRFISTEFVLALLFLPLLTIVMPIFIGKIRVRQIDSSPLPNYWLGYVYSAAGGVSAALLLLNLFEHVTLTTELIVASLFVYGIISWYTAIGIDLSIRHAEMDLASGLLKLEGRSNIFFGSIYAGSSPDKGEEV